MNNGTVATATDERRKVRVSHLRWVRIKDMVPAPLAQREFSPAWASKLASDFNLEGMGYPVVSLRGGTHYIVDGQHRVAALRLIGFEEDTVQCEVYESLSESDEAELFLERNNNKSVSALDKFLKAVNAGRPIETTINRVVMLNGLHIGRLRTNGNISAVSALRKVFDRHGEVGLGKVLRIIRDAYGHAGFEEYVLNGLSLCLHRYDGQIDEQAITARLANTHGGLNGLLEPAKKMRLSLGQPIAQCVAASAAAIYNREQKGKKLAPWWKE